MALLIPAYLERYLESQPAPSGMTSREIVRRAIEFDKPIRIPYSFAYPFQSDFFEILAVSPLIPHQNIERPSTLGQIYYDEWGIGQKVTGRGWDHATDYPLKDLKKLARERCLVIAQAFLENGCSL